jgi:hypothetical protein
MKHLLKPFARLFRDPDRQEPDNQPTDAKLPVGAAAFVCLACVAFVSLSGRFWVARLGGRWTEFLVYALIPVSITFIILYRSCWHLDMARPVRVGCLMLFSFLILGGDMLFFGIMVALFCIFVGISRVGPG